MRAIPRGDAVPLASPKVRRARAGIRAQQRTARETCRTRLRAPRATRPHTRRAHARIHRTRLRGCRAPSCRTRDRTRRRAAVVWPPRAWRIDDVRPELGGGRALERPARERHDCGALRRADELAQKRAADGARAPTIPHERHGASWTCDAAVHRIQLAASTRLSTTASADSRPAAAALRRRRSRFAPGRPRAADVRGERRRRASGRRR